MRVDQPFVIGDWKVEPDLSCILRGEERRAVRPQVMRLLVYLAVRNGAMARSEDILDDLWANKVVTDATLYNCVAELRRALDDGTGRRRYIETVHKKGYRLGEPVRPIAEKSRPQSRDAKSHSEANTALRIGVQRLNRRNLEGWKQAEMYFRRAVELDEGNSVAWQKLAASIVLQFGTFETTSDKLAEALHASERAIELDDENGLAWVWKARAMVAIAKAEDRDIRKQPFLSLYERAVKLSPNSDEAAREVGVFLMRLPGNSAAAIDYLERAVRLDPLNAENHFRLGQAYRLAKRSSAALKSLRRAYKLQPDNPYAIWDIGLTHYHDGRLAEAIQWGEQACEFERDDPSGPFLLAHVAMNLGRLDVAEHWIERGMRFAPDTPIAVATRMAFAVETDRPTEAVELANQLIPDFGEMRIVHAGAVAQALWVLRDYDIARGAFEVALARYRQVSPELFVESNMTGDFWLVAAIDVAYLYRVTGDDQRANRLLQSVMARSEDSQITERDIPVQWLKIEAMCLLGDKEGAELQLQGLAERNWIRWWHYTMSRPTSDEIRGSRAYQNTSALLDSHRKAENERYESMRAAQRSGRREPQNT